MSVPTYKNILQSKPVMSFIEEGSEGEPGKYQTVNVSQFLRSTNKMNKTLNSTGHSRQSKNKSRHSEDQDNQNLSPIELACRLRQRLRASQNRQARYRLQISHLKHCIEELSTQLNRLAEENSQLDSRLSRSNEYIFKLDNECRLLRTNIDRAAKIQKSADTSLKQENEEMRFVIQELLKEIQVLNKQIMNSTVDLEKRQNINEAMNALRTYPSSESSRKSSSVKTFDMPNVFEFTVNPKAIYRNEHINLEESSDAAKKNALSVINEHSMEVSSKAGTQQYIVSRMNQLTSLNQHSQSMFYRDSTSSV